MAKLSALGHLGIAPETVWGTAVVPAIFIPYETIKVEDDVKKIIDEARRANLSKDFQVYNASRQGKVEIGSDTYPEILGHLLKCILSSYAVTGSAGAYTHTFKVLNGLSPSLTISDYNTITERQYAGAIMEELGFKFDAENVMKQTAKFVSKGSATTTAATPSFTTTDPFMGFQAALTLGGVANINLVGGEMNIKRESKMLFTANNTIDPSKYSTGRIEFTGKLTFDIEDESEWLLYRNGTRPSFNIKFTRDASTSLEFNCTNVDFTKATIDRSQEWVRVDAEFRAFYNTTDAGMVAVTLKNAIATY